MIDRVSPEDWAWIRDQLRDILASMGMKATVYLREMAPDGRLDGVGAAVWMLKGDKHYRITSNAEFITGHMDEGNDVWSIVSERRLNPMRGSLNYADVVRDMILGITYDYINHMLPERRRTRDER